MHHNPSGRDLSHAELEQLCATTSTAAPAALLLAVRAAPMSSRTSAPPSSRSPPLPAKSVSLQATIAPQPTSSAPPMLSRVLPNPASAITLSSGAAAASGLVPPPFRPAVKATEAAWTDVDDIAHEYDHIFSILIIVFFLKHNDQ